MATASIDNANNTISLVGGTFYPSPAMFHLLPSHSLYFGKVFYYDFTHTLYLLYFFLSFSFYAFIGTVKFKRILKLFLRAQIFIPLILNIYKNI